MSLKLRILAALLAVVSACTTAMAGPVQDGASIAIAQAAAGQPASPVRVRFAVIGPGTLHAVYTIAKEQGLFARHGLDGELVSVDSTPSGLAALTSGAVQFAFTGANIADAVVAGVPITAIFASANVPIAEVCALSTIATPRDLIGKTIANNNRGSSPDLMFRIWLQRQGIDEGQVTIRNLDAGIAAILGAATSGAAQAFVATPPRCDQNAAGGFRVLADLGTSGTPFFNAGVAVNRDYLGANRGAVRSFLSALVDARRMFQQNRDVAIATIKTLDRITDDAAAEKIWTYFKSHLADPPLVSEEAIAAAVNASVNPKTREAGPAMVGRMYDNSVLTEVLGR